MTRRRPWRACTRHLWLSLAISSLLTILGGMLPAQDIFEIHVLEYEELHPGEFIFENHANYAPAGAKDATQSLLHNTYEVTAGVTDHFSFGVMQLSASGAGAPLEYAGWRLVPHVYVPRSWRWPVDVGFVAEFSFNSAFWSPNSRSVELLTILEKHFGPIQIDLNPGFGRPLSGPDRNRDRDFGLAIRLGFEATKRFAPSIEYYSDWGSLSTRQVFFGGDIRLANHVLWNAGIGVGLTPATDRLVFKSRLEISFGGKRRR